MKRWRTILGRFLGINTLTQAVALVVGILVVRGLTKEDYAAYAVFTSFLAAFVLLTDSGISGAVVGIATRRGDDEASVRAVFRTAQRFQHRVAWPQVLVGGASIACVLWLLGAGLDTLLTLSVGFVLVCVPLMNRSISVAYRRSMRHYGRLQVMNGANAVVRFTVVGLLSVARGVSLIALVLLSFASNVLDLVLLRGGERWGRGARAEIDRDAERDLRGVYFRALPVSVGVVAQTQLVTVVIGIAGGADVLAEVAALSRFAAVLAVFAAIVNDVGVSVVASSRG